MKDSRNYVTQLERTAMIFEKIKKNLLRTPFLFDLFYNKKRLEMYI